MFNVLLAAGQLLGEYHDNAYLQYLEGLEPDVDERDIQVTPRSCLLGADDHGQDSQNEPEDEDGVGDASVELILDDVYHQQRRDAGPDEYELVDEFGRRCSSRLVNRGGEGQQHGEDEQDDDDCPQHLIAPEDGVYPSAASLSDLLSYLHAGFGEAFGLCAHHACGFRSLFRPCGEASLRGTPPGTPLRCTALRASFFILHHPAFSFSLSTAALKSRPRSS